jgi:hypothetical protein
MPKIAPKLRISYKVVEGISLVQWILVTAPTLVAGLGAVIGGYPFHVVFLTALGALALVMMALAAWTVHRRASQPRAALPQPGKPHSALLYLTTVPQGEPFRHTGYWGEWTPSEAALISFRDFDSRREPGAPPKTQQLTFYLFNAGPSNVRHVRLTWLLANVDLPRLVEETGVFGDYVDQITETRLSLIAEPLHHWLALPISTEVQDSPIPVLKAGESNTVRSPVAFTNAFVAYALAEARRLIDNQRPPEDFSMRSIARQLERSRVPVQEVTIHAQYETDDGIQRQTFAMIGWLQGVGAVRSKVSDDPSEGAIAAWIDYVEVLDDGHLRQPR